MVQRAWSETIMAKGTFFELSFADKITSSGRIMASVTSSALAMSKITWSGLIMAKVTWSDLIMAKILLYGPVMTHPAVSPREDRAVETAERPDGSRQKGGGWRKAVGHMATGDGGTARPDNVMPDSVKTAAGTALSHTGIKNPSFRRDSVWNSRFRQETAHNHMYPT